MNIYPVIHHLNRGLTLEQVAIAKASGANGVFLISHHGNDDELVAIAAHAKGDHPDFAIGINLLSKPPIFAAFEARICGLDMVWADDMGVDSSGLAGRGVRLSALARDNPGVKLFASVAFKYQPHESSPDQAASNALAAGFIPTTSGAATGSAPEIEKIRLMSSAVAGNLAVASGMTPENVALYAPYLAHILVATGIGLDEYRIDPDRLGRLIRNAVSACEQEGRLP